MRLTAISKPAGAKDSSHALDIPVRLYRRRRELDPRRADARAEILASTASPAGLSAD
jgi:hypothetical protein